MNDILPPKRPNPQSVVSTSTPPEVEHRQASQPNVLANISDSSVQTPAKVRSRKLRWIVTAVAGLLILLIVGVVVWYQNALKPADPSSDSKQLIKVEPGATLSQVGVELKQKQLIRSQKAFDIYTRISNVDGDMKVGSYRISPSESLPEIVTHLTSGKTDEISVTFYPGATLFDPRDSIKDNQRTDVYTMLRRVGFSDEEVRSGLKKDYDHPLLQDKPRGASLEGYVLGDTYRFAADASVEDILSHTFDVFYQRIQKRNLITKLKKQDMNLHEGLTLASIIEREVSGRETDQKQVSQVFHLRLEKGMPLGADATFQYVAQQRNVAPSITIDSPYNTRINKGLPPGPIASPHLSAIEAAAEPAKGDYLYFVSGDDGTTHFAHTDKEHQANTRKYCTTLCEQT